MDGATTSCKGRFKAIVVDRDSYLLELCRARRTRKPETYPWSSYRATAGLIATPPFLTVDLLLSQFDRHRLAAQRRYRAFVAEGMGQGSPWEHVQGSAAAREQAVRRTSDTGLQDKRSLKEIPR